MNPIKDLAYLFVIIIISMVLVVVLIDREGQRESRPSVELIQPISVGVDSQVLALSVLLASADRYDGRCEEDEYYWFTGDFDGDQWVRQCIPVDAVDVLYVQ